MYPWAKIIAIEPEESNFSILEKNTEKLKNVKRIKAGLWSKNSFLKIIDKHVSKWSFRVKEVWEWENYDIKGIDIETVLKESGFDNVDILKLDIEGTEKEIFSKNYKSWINKINIIVIEEHDRIIAGCTEALYWAIDIEEWIECKKGEKIILIRRTFLWNINEPKN